MLDLVLHLAKRLKKNAALAVLAMTVNVLNAILVVLCVKHGSCCLGTTQSKFHRL